MIDVDIIRIIPVKSNVPIVYWIENWSTEPDIVCSNNTMQSLAAKVVHHQPIINCEQPAGSCASIVSNCEHCVVIGSGPAYLRPAMIYPEH